MESTTAEALRLSDRASLLALAVRQLAMLLLLHLEPQRRRFPRAFWCQVKRLPCTLLCCACWRQRRWLCQAWPRPKSEVRHWSLRMMLVCYC